MKSPQILRGSFSAVWTATIARVVAFFTIFRDLQDLHFFAPLTLQNFSKKRVPILVILKKKIHKILFENAIFHPDFDEFFSEFHEKV